MNTSTETKKRLHIAMVCDAVDYTAGVSISARRFSERLSARGHKIVFIAARSPHHLEDSYYKDMVVHRFPSLLLPKSEKKFYLAFPTKKNLEKIFRDEDIDIVHLWLPTPASINAIRAARALGIKVLGHSHSQPENLFLALPKILAFLHTPLTWLFEHYIAWIYKQADVVLYPSEFARKLFPQISAVKKTCVISNGVDTSRFRKVGTEAFLKKYNLLHDNNTVLFVGRLHAEKSVSTLIKAMPLVLEKNPRSRAWIAGEGYEENELRKLVKSLGLQKHIAFLGKLHEDDLIPAYNACDIFVLPSLAELEGMVILEAMACGKPIIVANSPSSASTYFVDHNGFLFKPQDEKDLAKQINTLLSDNALRKKMGEESFIQSRKYDINQSVSNLENLYDDLLAHS